MGCDYYTESQLVIEYVDVNGIVHMKVLHVSDIEPHYIFSYGYVSDDDEDTNHDRFNEALQKAISEHTYIKMLYDNEEWKELSYETAYAGWTNSIVGMGKMLKLYYNRDAWER